MSNSIDDLNSRIQKFADDRDWDQFHTLKNLLLALVGEVGELAEIIQWKTDMEVDTYLNTIEGKIRISEELADIAIYLLRISQKAEINFIEAISLKLEANESKYPVGLAKGSSKKYTELA